MKVSACSVVLWLALICVSAALCAETAQTNYRSVYGVFHARSLVDKYPRLIAISKIESKDPSVSPDRIQIEIRSRQGTIRVPIDAQGRVDFPMSDALVEENPVVASDQPAGSLRVSLAIEVRVPSSAEIAYAVLLQAIEDVESATSALSDGETRPVIDGLEFRFQPDSAAHVTVSWEGGEDFLVADSQGRVFLSRHLSDSRRSAARLHFSTAPLRVLPRIGRP